MTEAQASLDTLPARLENAESYAARDVPIAAPEDTVASVRARLGGHRFETAQAVAVCRGRRLAGIVNIEHLLAAAADASMATIMDADTPTVAPGLDRERAAHQLIVHGETTLAVVDGDGAFIGLIPAQRMLAVLLDEHDEDLRRFSGVLRSSESARTSSVEPVPRRLRHRLPWLVLGLAGAMASAALLGSFEAQLSERVTLAFFLPAIVYMADAVGTQTETLAVRGLSVGVHVRDILGKELLSGALIGALIAAALFPFALVMWHDADLAVVISVSLLASCTVASVVALLLPWLLSRLGKDPAFGSGPLATVIQDLLSLVIYLTVATIVFG